MECEDGKLERFHGTIKCECIRPKTPLSINDARRMIGEYVLHYNQTRLHSAIGYVTPGDKLEGRESEIFALRDRRLAQARQRRRKKRSATHKSKSEQGQAQGEIIFPFERTTQKSQDRQGCQVEAGINSERASGFMPEVHLTETTERGTDMRTNEKRKTETATLA